MSKISLVLGDTVALYDRVTDSRTGWPLDLSAYTGSDTLRILIVNKRDSTKTTTKTCTPMVFTGTATFTNGSATVTGTGTKFVNEVSVGDWLHLSADTNSWGVVKSVESDTSLTLTAAYAGTGGAAGVFSARGKIATTLTVADFTFASVPTAGDYLAETLVNIGGVPHYGSTNSIEVESALSSYVAP